MVRQLVDYSKCACARQPPRPQWRRELELAACIHGNSFFPLFMHNQKCQRKFLQVLSGGLAVAGENESRADCCACK